MARGNCSTSGIDIERGRTRNKRKENEHHLTLSGAIFFEGSASLRARLRAVGRRFLQTDQARQEYGVVLVSVAILLPLVPGKQQRLCMWGEENGVERAALSRSHSPLLW